MESGPLLKSVSLVEALWVSRFLFWVVVLLLWIYARKIELKPLLPWKGKKRKFSFYLLSVIGVMLVTYGGLIIIGVLFYILNIPLNLDKLIALKEVLCGYPILMIMSCITAGFTEEIIFRGYLLTRFSKLFNSKVIGVILSAFLFSLAHTGYHSWVEYVSTFMMGIVFAIHYSKYKNITVLIIAHFLFDFISFAGHCYG